MTLKRFVKESGGQEKAAGKLEVAFTTLNRWIKGHSFPSPLAIGKMKSFGISKIGTRALA